MMNIPPRRERPGSGIWLYRYALFVAVYVVFLLGAGAMVTSTGSGLAVPDWPLSFGQVMPPMEGGVFYEHGHRMVAAGLGVLTIVLSVWLWKVERRPWLRRLGWAALGLVIAQGVLGGVTVLLKLPLLTSVLHACLAQAFFLVAVFIALALAPGWGDIPRGSGPSRLPSLSLLTTGAIYVQLILGAVMRHMHAGLAIPDFPLVFGGLWPPAFTPGVAVHLLHRLWAVVVVAAVLATWFETRRSTDWAGLRRPATILVALVVVQFSLGAWVILSARQTHVATTHVVVGALLLAASLVVSTRAQRHLRGPAAARLAARLPIPEGARS
jgi:cytochrome c oxidase assembly protein subunit 15